jgi:lysozyme family protein
VELRPRRGQYDGLGRRVITPEAEAFTLREEGGRKPPDAGDPNPTQFGVTQRAYDQFRARFGLGSQPVYDITEEERHAVYEDYWQAAGGDDLAALSPALALLHFDHAFNAGPHQAGLTLQETVDAPQDGVIGPVTMSAVQRCMVSEPTAILMAYLQNRWSFLQTLHNFPQWGAVWKRRVNACAKAINVNWSAA